LVDGVPNHQAPPDNCAADFDESGDVGVTDFLILLSSWG
jgi:hypothetical protein